MDFDTDLTLSSGQFRSLMEFSEIVMQAPTYADLFAGGQRFFESIGATAISCGMFEQRSNFLIGASSNLDESWLEQYVAQDLVEIDPVVTHCEHKEGPGALGWGDPSRVPDRPESMKVLQCAAEAGYPNVVVVPVKPKDQAYTSAVVFFNDMADGQAQQFVRENGGLIVLSGNLMGLRAVQLFRQGEEDESWQPLKRSVLSPRETEVLKWLAKGLRTDQIAFQMNLKPVTIHMHLTSARRKLGARTREQLMAMAAICGLL